MIFQTYRDNQGLEVDRELGQAILDIKAQYTHHLFRKYIKLFQLSFSKEEMSSHHSAKTNPRKWRRRDISVTLVEQYLIELNITINVLNALNLNGLEMINNQRILAL